MLIEAKVFIACMNKESCEHDENCGCHCVRHHYGTVSAIQTTIGNILGSVVEIILCLMYFVVHPLLELCQFVV